jgi:uncharacterized protein YbjT (DUF2867 family)
MLPGVEVVEFGGYGDEDCIRKAFAGVSTPFLCSAKEAEDRAARHRSVVDAAVNAGVERIVYLSIIAAGPHATFTLARDHYDTEQYIRSSGIPFTSRGRACTPTSCRCSPERTASSEGRPVTGALHPSCATTWPTSS